MGHYYYLVAGLANLDSDDGRPQLSLEDFRKEVFPQVSAADRCLLEMPLVECDCHRLAAFLTDGLIPESMPQGLLSSASLENAVEQAKSGENRPDEILPFMWNFLVGYFGSENREGVVDRLLSVFYEYAMNAGNTFVSDWYAFNLNLNNVRTAIAARKYGLDIQNLIVGDNETANQLRTSGARDWGLSGNLDFFDELLRIHDEQDLAKREHAVDYLRWRWLEQNSFFSYFTVESLFSYMERLSMAWRWNSLDHDGGEAILRGLIGELKGQVKVPDEFGND
ncbi:MAG: DUF2764 domain-containing protein [Bacteroidaceae bacterium]|nr:DUF2764 domain-containing protein [Bacteroidaceae bacterium]